MSVVCCILLSSECLTGCPLDRTVQSEVWKIFQKDRKFGFLCFGRKHLKKKCAIIYSGLTDSKISDWRHLLYSQDICLPTIMYSHLLRGDVIMRLVTICKGITCINLANNLVMCLKRRAATTCIVTHFQHCSPGR